tara:strand:- start:551 stop:940 length:390 start_codon:yes stop_codon:yes gene_type:complete
VHLKTFRASHDNNFEVYEDKMMMGTKNMKNITLDSKSQLFSVRVEKFRSAKSVNIIKNIFVDKTSHELTIRIPEILLNKEMFEPANQLERLIQSDDGKLLMCGKLIMKLNDTHDDLDQIGCIMMTPGEA